MRYFAGDHDEVTDLKLHIEGLEKSLKWWEETCRLKNEYIERLERQQSANETPASP